MMLILVWFSYEFVGGGEGRFLGGVIGEFLGGGGGWYSLTSLSDVNFTLVFR